MTKALDADAQAAEAADQLNSLKGAAEQMLDLANLDTRKLGSAACELFHPVTKEKLGQTIWLFSKDHPKVQSYMADRADRDLRNEANLSARGKQPDPPTVAKGRERAIELLTIATDRWENVFFKGQADVAFSVSLAKEVYEVPFIREQCLGFLGEIENFTNG